MSERVRAYAPGEGVAIELRFTCKGDAEIESVEAVFVREGSGGEISLLGDARKEDPGRGQIALYAARLEAKLDPGAAPGEYRCSRLFARDRFDDDREFADAAKLDLVVRVERVPRRLEVTASEFL